MRRLIARIAISIALLLIALVAAVVALGYFAFALYLLLVLYLVPPAAAVVSGLIVLVVALIMVMIARALLPGSGRRERHAAPLSAMENAAEVGSLFSDKMQDFADTHRGTTMMVALIAGFAVGFSPKLRGTLWRLFKTFT
jgi:hypothetical protein